MAWIIPGNQKKQVRTRLIQKSVPRPTVKNTPRGGIKIAATMRIKLPISVTPNEFSLSI
jgi:hypothetical protein